MAQRIADLTGAEVIDGFRAPPPESEIAAVIVDCGGTARAGVYPRKRIPTVNLTPVGQAGPLAQFITEDIMSPGVRPQNVNLADDSEAAGAPEGDGDERSTYEPVRHGGRGGGAAAAASAAEEQPQGGGGFTGFIACFGAAWAASSGYSSRAVASP